MALESQLKALEDKLTKVSGHLVGAFQVLSSNLTWLRTLQGDIWELTTSNDELQMKVEQQVEVIYSLQDAIW